MPNAYLITFCCYGKWLPGQPGAVDRKHSLPGSRAMPESHPLERHARSSMPDQSRKLHAAQRIAVLDALLGVCMHQGWSRIAVHVRSDHVHVVVNADTKPEKVMVVFKRYASRALNRGNSSETQRRWWARHGSTRYLWTKDEVSAAVRYVVEGQGEPMAWWAE